MLIRAEPYPPVMAASSSSIGDTQATERRQLLITCFVTALN